MARSQTWARNLSKKVKPGAAPARPRVVRIVDGNGLERLKRRAEEVGLIIHARPQPRGKK